MVNGRPHLFGIFSSMDTLFLMAATGLVLVALLYFCVGDVRSN